MIRWQDIRNRPARRQSWWTRLRNALAEAWYFVRCHTYDRYHIVNLAGADGEYRWGWIECDHAMMLACFTLLVDFVENQDPQVGLRSINDYCKHDGTPEDCAFQHEAVRHQLRRDHEIRQLYTWWTKLRPIRRAWAEEHNQEWDADEKDQRMLQRLISVRRSCWV